MARKSKHLPRVEQLEPRLLMSTSPLPDLSFAQALELPRNGQATVTGEVVAGEQLQLYKITPQYQGSVSVDMAAANKSPLDPYLDIYNSQGQLVLSNNDAAAGTLDSSISSWQIQPGEDYYILPSGYGGTSGAYGLTVTTSSKDDVADTLESAAAKALDKRGAARFSGKIGAAGDQDVFSVVAKFTGTMDVSMRPWARSAVNAVLYAYDADGNLLAHRDDPASKAAAMTFEVIAGRTYYLRGASAAGTGSYIMKLLNEPGAVNQSPVLDPVADQALSEASTLVLGLSATDPDGDALAYWASSLPEGAIFDSAARLLTWTPDYDQAGSYAVTFAVSDGQLSDSLAVMLDVANTNRSPLLEAIADQELMEGQTLQLTVSGSDPDGDLLTYSASTLPTGATFDPDVRTLTWTPAEGQADVYLISFAVADGDLSHSRAALITVGTDQTASLPEGTVEANVLYIDRDGDGYGVASPLGPDADDADPDVNTADSMLAKYSSLDSFLDHMGYSPQRIFYVATDGDDATGQVDDVNSPYATSASIRGQLQPGDMVIYRGGTYASENYPVSASFLNGEDGNPIVYLAYPGEKVVLDSEKVPIGVGNSSNLIFDGFVTDRSIGGKLSFGVSMSKSSNITFKNIEAMNFSSGVKATHIHNVVFDSSVFHDNSEHGIYLCAREIISTDVTFSNSLSYHNARHGIQHNGRVTNLIIENNVLHSNSLGGVNLMQGVSDSIVRNNLIFNNNRSGIYLYQYDDRGLTIHTFDQNNNVIENNIIWIGTYSWQDDGRTEPDTRTAIRFNDATADQATTMDGTIIRNNIIVSQDGSTIAFDQARFADTTTLENNLIYRTGGDAMVMEVAGATYDFNAMEAFSALMGSNTFADPLFEDVSVDYFTDPNLFDFDVLASSPAVDMGLTAGLQS